MTSIEKEGGLENTNPEIALLDMEILNIVAT